MLHSPRYVGNVGERGRLARNKKAVAVIVLATLAWFLAATYAVIVAIWGCAYLILCRLDQQRIRLTPVAEWRPDRPAPSLAVIIACHNEEQGIAACVRQLQAQNYPNLQIVVANDRSTDGTGEILRDLASRDGRIRVVENAELPPGWVGKSHAVHCAVRACQADYLLFLDSDVELAPHALVSAMDKVCRDGVDFLTLWPRLDLRSFSERLLTPPALVALGAWAMPHFSTGGASGVAIGNGQFMLVRRQAYEAIGGHTGVGNELAEDAVLAAKARDAGQCCWSGMGDGLYSAYRVGDFSRTANSLARVFIGTLCTPWRILASTQILTAGTFTAAWVLPAAAICLALGFYPALFSVFLVLNGLHWIVATATLRRMFAMTLVRPAGLIWYPIGSAICAGILFWCLYLLVTGGRLRWGTTEYRVHGSRVAPVTTD